MLSFCLCRNLTYGGYIDRPQAAHALELADLKRGLAKSFGDPSATSTNNPRWFIPLLVRHSNVHR